MSNRDVYKACVCVYVCMGYLQCIQCIRLGGDSVRVAEDLFIYS